jgi:hypothetical protein
MPVRQMVLTKQGQRQAASTVMLILKIQTIMPG